MLQQSCQIPNHAVTASERRWQSTGIDNAAGRRHIIFRSVHGAYFPVLTLTALGGYQSEPFPAPKEVAPSGYFRVNVLQVFPTLNLRWLLLDFGRRGNALDAAQERLLAANLGFNRKHQEIVLRVQRAFFGLRGCAPKSRWPRVPSRRPAPSASRRRRNCVRVSLLSRRSRSRGSRKRSPYEGMTTEAMVLLCAREICSYLLLLCVI